MPKPNTPQLVALDAEQINQVITWAREAGHLARQYFRKVTPQYKADKTFLTQADLAVERFLGEKLRGAFPEYNLIGEEGGQDKNSESFNDKTLSDEALASEGDSDEPHSAPPMWVIDPIDGTTAFVQGLPGWGIAIGLLHQGWPCFGLFYMPLLDDITYTNSAGAVYWQDHRLSGTLRQDWTQRGFLAINAAAHADFHITTIRHSRALGSIGANLVYTTRGTAVATFIPKARLWDLVAGAAILNGVGGELRYLSGQAIDYLALQDGRLAPEPIIAGHPKVLDTLAGAIQPH